MYRRITMLMLLALAAGCGDDDPSSPLPLPESSFELEITGAVTESASGNALFGSDTDPEGNPLFALVLGDDTTRHTITAGIPGTSRPGTGTFEITAPEAGENGWTLVHIISDGDELLGLFVAESGTLTITESTADVLRGTLEFQATGFLGEDSDSMSVAGSFTAVRATAPAAAAGRAN